MGSEKAIALPMMQGRSFPKRARVEGVLETVSGLLVARNSVRRTLEALERGAPRSLRSEAVVDVAVVLPG